MDVRSPDEELIQQAINYAMSKMWYGAEISDFVSALYEFTDMECTTRP